MKGKVQVVTITDDGEETTRDIACVERQDLAPETLGLSLAEGQAVLQALQEVVVEWQLHAYLQQQRLCPHCGKARRSKGVHHTMFRTVFGVIPVDSPRLYHCACQAHATTSFSPLAALLPEHTTPDLLCLETKWAVLMSYGLTVTLLQDVLPIDKPLEAVTIRNPVLQAAERLEAALGEEQWSFIDDTAAPGYTTVGASARTPTWTNRAPTAARGATPFSTTDARCSKDEGDPAGNGALVRWGETGGRGLQ